MIPTNCQEPRRCLVCGTLLSEKNKKEFCPTGTLRVEARESVPLLEQAGPTQVEHAGPV
jgi:hypothetical protein